MKTEPLTRQQKTIRLYLAKVAARRDMVNYTKLCNDCRLPYTMANPDHRAKLGHDLGAISEQEVRDFHRPMLSSVTVTYNGGSARPSRGFFNMAEYLYGEKIYEDEEKFFYDEMTKAHDFWASPNGKLEIAKMEKDLLTDGII